MNYVSQSLQNSVGSMLVEAFNPYSQYANLPSISTIAELFKDYPEDMSDIDVMNCIKYFREIVIPHKIHVFNEGLNLLENQVLFGQYSINQDDFLKRLMHHDLSKFSYTEALGYMHKHFKEIDWNSREFKLAWNHHKQNNDHHAENWMSVNSSGKVEFLEMSPIAIMENFADWKGAGHTYGETFEDWFPENCKRFKFNPATAVIYADIAQFLLSDRHVSIVDYPLEGCSSLAVE